MAEENDERQFPRREFLVKVLQLPCSAALLTVLEPLADAAEASEGGSETAEHNFGMGIQVDKCIGCGNCVEACKAENDVPREPYYFRTWVERYVIHNDGEVSVDSPEGGIRGFPLQEGEGDELRSFFVPKLCNQCDNPPLRAGLPGGGDVQDR